MVISTLLTKDGFHGEPMKWKLIPAAVLLLFSIVQGQTQTPGIQLGTFTATQALNVAPANKATTFKWSLSPFPINPNGTLYLNYNKITTSGPSAVGCTIKILFGATNVTAFSNTFVAFAGTLIPINPGQLPFAVRVTSFGTPGISYTSLTPQYQCTTYPTGGTITYEFVPDTSANNAYNWKHITAAGCYQLQSAPPGGLLHTVVFGEPGMQVTVFDNTTCTDSTGNQTISVISASSSDQNFLFDVATTTGLSILVVNSGDLTITYR